MNFMLRRGHVLPRFWWYCALLAAVAVCCPEMHAQGVVLSNGAGAYATGHYEDLFAAQGHSQAQITRKIDKAFEQLFFGNAKTQAVYFAAGRNANGPLAYVTDWANHDVRTEGMSYGMMIAVQLNRKDVFDALWNWAMTYMYLSDPRQPAHGYFSWSCKTDGVPNEQTPAPDGEEYFAMALDFASARWGDGSGIYDYKAEADRLLSTMVHHPVKSGMTMYGPRTIGPEMNADNFMVRFVPGRFGANFTDPSYHLPSFYELWARWGPLRDRAFWAKAAVTSRAFFAKTANAKTGLAPSYANFDGTPKQTRFAQSSVFGYDAWRVASNWAMDWSWWRKDPEEQVLSNRIQGFFDSQGIDRYGDQYTLDGKELEDIHATGLVAANAAASLAATGPYAGKFVEALWNAPIPSGHERYYDGMLYLLNMLHVSGRFRIWGPPR